MRSYPIFLILCFIGFCENKIYAPSIECGNKQITIIVHTDDKHFKGNVYAKGFFHKPECRKIGSSQNGSVEIALSVAGECGIRRKRMANPRGLQLDATLVLMGHPVFVTQGDKAFHIQCKYLEEETLVTRSLTVSMHLPTELPPVDGLPTLPICIYQVLKEKEDGEVLQYATIGEVIYHKWTCKAEHSEHFCMTVHSCMVDDGQGNGQLIINEYGCSLDNFILEDLHYSDNLTAGQKSHVFKFADKATVFFSCMIKLYLKETPEDVCPIPNERCKETTTNSGIIPVTAPNRLEGPVSFDFPRPGEHNETDDQFPASEHYQINFIQEEERNRDARSLRRRSIDVDVAAQTLQVIDTPDTDIPNADGIYFDDEEILDKNADMCFTGFIVFIYISILASLLSTSSFLLYVIHKRLKFYPFMSNKPAPPTLPPPTI